MLRRHELNEERFQDILGNMTARAREIYPEWTNFNPSEPGLTLLELFAWLHEMQRFHLNHTHPETLEKLLSMLGGRVREATPAKTLVSVTAQTETELPSGTALDAQGVPFETVGEAVVYPHKVIAFLTRDELGQLMATRIPENGELQMLPVTAGAAFYIGFDRAPPVGVPFGLYFHIRDDSGRNPRSAEFDPNLAKLYWQAMGADGYFDVAVLSDETQAFLYSGLVTLRFEQRTEPVWQSGLGGAHLLRITLDECAYESPRRLVDVTLNNIPVRQTRTVYEPDTSTAPDGEAVMHRFEKTMGAGGNVKAGAICRFHPELPGLSLYNCFPAEGGADGETVAEALGAFLGTEVSRCVTAEDYEAMALRTPGLALRRAKAFCADDAENTVVVTAQPYGGRADAPLSEGYRRAINRYLEQFRLITTRVQVVPPRYVFADVTAEVYDGGQRTDTRNALREASQTFFASLGFGEAAFHTELYGTLDALCGGILSLCLTPDSWVGSRTRDGGIVPPPHGLLILRELDIRVLNA